MKNFVKSGYIVTKANAAAVESGAPVINGTELLVSSGKYAANEAGEYARAGVFALKKKAGQAQAQGAKIYYDLSADEITTTALDGDVDAGIVDKAALAGDATVDVLLNGKPYSFN